MRLVIVCYNGIIAVIYSLWAVLVFVGWYFNAVILFVQNVRWYRPASWCYNHKLQCNLICGVTEIIITVLIVKQSSRNFRFDYTDPSVDVKKLKKSVSSNHVELLRHYTIL